VSIVRNGDAVDDVMRIAFGNRAVVVSLDWTTAFVAYAGNGNAADREVRCAHAFDFAAVRR
jgi:hypothetical protein